MHTQAGLLWNIVNATLYQDLTSRDHVLTVLPMFHVGGLCIQTLPALHAGATVTIHARFDASAFLRDVAARRPTLTLLVPATLKAIYAHPEWERTDLSSLREVNTGSSTVPDSLFAPFHARGIPVGQVYGATETGPVSIYLRAEDAIRKAGSAGKAAVHAEIRLVDAEGRDVAPGEVGEILVRAPNLMQGYWKDSGQPRVPRRLVPHRRPRARGRRGLLLGRRPHQGHDHLGRRERVSGRARERARRLRCDRRGGRRRHPRSAVGRGGRRGDREEAGRGARRRRPYFRSSTAGSRASSIRVASSSSRACRRARSAKCRSSSCGSF